MHLELAHIRSTLGLSSFRCSEFLLKFPWNYEQLLLLLWLFRLRLQITIRTWPLGRMFLNECYSSRQYMDAVAKRCAYLHISGQSGLLFGKNGVRSQTPNEHLERLWWQIPISESGQHSLRYHQVRFAFLFYFHFYQKSHSSINFLVWQSNSQHWWACRYSHSAHSATSYLARACRRLEL